MDSENEKLVRRCIGLWYARDFEAMEPVVDEEFVLDLSRNLDAEVFPGLDGLRRWTERVGEMWDDFQIEPKELVDAGEAVVTRARLSGRGRASGVDAEMEVFQVWALRDGKVLRISGGYRDRAEAMADAGRAA